MVFSDTHRVNVDVPAIGRCICSVRAAVRVCLAGYGIAQSDTTDLLFIGHVRVTVVAHQLVDCGELDILEVEGGRRPFNVEVLYTGRMTATAHLQYRAAHNKNSNA